MSNMLSGLDGWMYIGCEKEAPLPCGLSRTCDDEGRISTDSELDSRL